jgi:hypothetical protein
LFRAVLVAVVFTLITMLLTVVACDDFRIRHTASLGSLFCKL